MECSICGHKIEGEPGAKFIIKDGTGSVLLDMVTCGQVICFRSASAAVQIIMSRMEAAQ